MHSNITLQFVVLVVVLSGCAEKIDTPAEFVELALRHERESEFAEAAAAYRQAIELEPGSAETWYDLGVATAAQDKLSEALEAYSKAIELDPTLARAFNNRAAVYARLSQFDQAVDDCTQALTLNPEDALAWRNRGLALYDQDDFERAAADFDESIRIAGQDAETYLFRGNVYLELQDPVRALEDFDHALHLNAELGDAWLGRAKSLSSLDRTADAESALKKSRELGVESSDEVLGPWSISSAPGPVLAGTDSESNALGVATEFLKAEYPNLERATTPWDLMSSGADGSDGFVVRVVDSDQCVRFADSDLQQIRQRDDVSTTLLILTRDDSGGLAVGARYTRWDADPIAMQPSMWSLRIGIGETPAAPEPENVESVTAVE